MTTLSELEKIEIYGKQLLAWYGQIQRDLPWRHNHDPYRIWVSEIMLQQTRVDTVIPYYLTFMDKFPTVKALAEASEEEVVKCWEGLGYYSRARNLQAGARMVMEQYGGVVPDKVEEVAKLKGVGPYTCGAIMSIAYNEPVPAVDGNVMRVLSRFFLLEDDIAKPATRVKIEKLAAKMIPEGQARYFNQALMELGALLCTPKSPGCLICPVMENCEARIQGKELEIPIKTKAKKARVEYRVAAIIAGTGPHEGKLLVRQRPSEGLLSGMWELPHIILEEEKAAPLFADELKEQPELGAALSSQLFKQDQLLVKPESWYSDEEHLFSHIRWRMRFFRAYLDEEQLHQFNNEASSKVNRQWVANESMAAEQAAEYKNEQENNPGQPFITNNNEQYRFISMEDMKTLPFPNLFLKVIKRYWEEVMKGS